MILYIIKMKQENAIQNQSLCSRALEASIDHLKCNILALSFLSSINKQ